MPGEHFTHPLPHSPCDGAADVSANDAAFDTLILGAGAAGLMCALTASRKGSTRPASIAVADSAPVAGKKMRLAGGGMGNITNRDLSPDWYVGSHPDFVRPALRKFPFRAALDLLESFHLRWEERDFGQIFGLQPAVRLVEGMVERCRQQGVSFLMRHSVVKAFHDSDSFVVHFKKDDVARSIRAKRLVLALGSPAWPTSGATDAGLALARQFGHACVPFRPVLVPLILPESHPLRGLQGISVKAGLRAGRRQLVRPLLFTHKGWSGPAGLIASCFWHKEEQILIDFLPEYKGLPDTAGQGRLPVSTLLRRLLPQRLADALCRAVFRAMAEKDLTPPPPSRPLAEWNSRQRAVLSHVIHEHDLTPVRTEGMQKAEASAGGVATEAVNPRTLESLIQPGLFITGELLDIAGLLGGYNLHWAMACGKAAGEALRRAADR